MTSESFKVSGGHLVGECWKKECHLPGKLFDFPGSQLPTLAASGRTFLPNKHSWSLDIESRKSSLTYTIKALSVILIVSVLCLLIIIKSHRTLEFIEIVCFFFPNDLKDKNY